ncbi:MAG: DJ-1/PfpI family protein [bacterium]
MPKKRAKSILMVIAHHNFRDEEYNTTREKLESIGAQITVASTVKNGASGSQGMRLNPDLLIDEVVPKQYDAVVFIGGSGASQYWHDVKAQEIAQVAVNNGKVVGAISHAPVTLALAGLLKGKKVTGHVSIFEKLAVHGAKYTGKKLEQEDNIITSSGPNAAKEFAEALVKSLNQIE